MVRPANSAMPHEIQSTLRASMAMVGSLMNITRPTTSAAAAGLGRPWKKRLSTTSMLVLKRARRSAAPAPSVRGRRRKRAKRGALLAPAGFLRRGRGAMVLLLEKQRTGATLALYGRAPVLANRYREP